MKKSKQDKKLQQQQNTTLSKEIKLPLIQSNIQKGNVKETQSNSSKQKTIQKNTNSKSSLIDIPQVPMIPNISLPKSNPKERKSFGSTHISQSTNKTRTKSGSRKKKYFYYYNNFKEEQNPNNEYIKEEVPRISKEKLAQLKEQRRKRLQEAKKEEEKELKLYAQIIEEYKNNSRDKNKNNEIFEENKVPKVSGQKAQKILEEGGMLDAYKHVLAQLCKHGLPSGNIFEYASIVVKNYEKKWKEKKSKMMKEKIDKYYEEKQKEMNHTLETEGEIKTINKSLEHREELKFIQNLDKSRSGRNVVPRLNSPQSQDNLSNLGRLLNKNIKIMKETKSSQGKDEIMTNPKKSRQTSMEKNNLVMKNNNIANSTLTSEYNKNNNKKQNNNNKFIEKENINNVVNNNRSVTKNKKGK